MKRIYVSKNSDRQSLSELISVLLCEGVNFEICPVYKDGKLENFYEPLFTKIILKNTTVNKIDKIDLYVFENLSKNICLDIELVK